MAGVYSLQMPAIWTLNRRQNGPGARTGEKTVNYEKDSSTLPRAGPRGDRHHGVGSASSHPWPRHAGQCPLHEGPGRRRGQGLSQLRPMPRPAKALRPGQRLSGRPARRLRSPARWYRWPVPKQELSYSAGALGNTQGGGQYGCRLPSDGLSINTGLLGRGFVAVSGQFRRFSSL